MDTRVVLKLPPFPDARTAAPTPADEASNAVLAAFVQTHCPVASGTRQRQALQQLHVLFQSWCKCAFHTFISGSYRIGVHTDEADIDVLFVLPAAVTRAQVFTDFVAVLQQCEGVTDLQPIPKARVPIIALKFHGQEFDILTCHLREQVLPLRDSMLQSYEWMNGLDDECVLGFNGPRVTETILNSLPRPNQFFTALRFLRHWAKQRFLYSNKSGYLGGVNLALMLCYIAQTHPTAVAAGLVSRFFDTYAKWRWGKSTPVQLDGHVDHACPVWLRSLEWFAKHTEVMVILTPCFPRFNTTYAASKYSCQIMSQELVRASKELAGSGGQLTPGCLARACAPLDCFRTCTRFLRLAVTAPDTKAGASWQGYIEAQTRFLIQYLAQEELAVAEFRYIPTWATHMGLDAAGTPTRTRETYITADDDGKIRAYKVRGLLSRPRDYFMEAHAHNGPPMPPASNVQVSFCDKTCIPPGLVPPSDCAELEAPTAPVPAPVPVPQVAAPLPVPAPAPVPKRDLFQEARALRTQGAVKPPPARMLRIILRPEAAAVPAVQTVVVRPCIVSGRDTATWSVYISEQCTVAGLRFPASPFAISSVAKSALGTYKQQAEAACALDPSFKRALAELHGKRLACWCSPAQQASTCHGQVLASLAAEFQSWLDAQTRARPAKVRRTHA